MNALHTEWDRLYHTHGHANADDPVRALVLELRQPADWSALAAVWGGVQADLDLPAPAIAVNGVDGHQLWFSLQEPLAAAHALAFLEALRARYLGAVPTARVRLLAGATQRAAQAVPAKQANGHWSAYVAPDLAAIFSDEPWLDVAPSPQAQAKVLAGIDSIRPGALQSAMQRLQPSCTDAQADGASDGPAQSTTPHTSARAFLLSVMNDSTIPLPLRLEAAKALLPYGDR